MIKKFVFFSETNVSIKTLYSTRRVQFWQLCQTFDTKFWINFVSKSEIDYNTLFFWQRNLLMLIMFLWTRRIQLWKPCRTFYSACWKFLRQNPKRMMGKYFFQRENFGYNVTLDMQNSVQITFLNFFLKTSE